MFIRSFFIFLFFSQALHAAELTLGIAPTYSQITIAGPSGSGVYQGAGASADLRLKFRQLSLIGFDVFGQYSAQFLKNTDKTTAENAKSISYGGGVDLTMIKVLFVGGMFENVSLRLSQPGSTSKLFHRTYGPRGGFNFALSKNMRISLGGAMLVGDTSIQSGTRILPKKHTEFRGFFLISWAVL